MARFTTNNDLPQSTETWENRMSHRAEVLKDARENGDPKFIERAEERLNHAIDSYSRNKNH